MRIALGIYALIFASLIFAHLRTRWNSFSTILSLFIFLDPVYFLLASLFDRVSINYLVFGGYEANSGGFFSDYFKYGYFALLFLILILVLKVSLSENSRSPHLIILAISFLCFQVYFSSGTNLRTAIFVITIFLAFLFGKRFKHEKTMNMEFNFAVILVLFAAQTIFTQLYSVPCINSVKCQFTQSFFIGPYAHPNIFAGTLILLLIAIRFERAEDARVLKLSLASIPILYFTVSRTALFACLALLTLSALHKNFPIIREILAKPRFLKSIIVAYFCTPILISTAGIRINSLGNRNIFWNLDPISNLSSLFFGMTRDTWLEKMNYLNPNLSIAGLYSPHNFPLTVWTFGGIFIFIFFAFIFVRVSLQSSHHAIAIISLITFSSTESFFSWEAASTWNWFLILLIFIFSQNASTWSKSVTRSTRLAQR
jgi:hypothetical protein